MRKDIIYAVGKNADIYISLVSFIESGLRDIKKFPEQLAGARRENEKLRASIEAVYLTMGDSDLLKIADIPDDATVAILVRLSTQGHARTKTMEAFPEEACLVIGKVV